MWFITEIQWHFSKTSSIQCYSVSLILVGEVKQKCMCIYTHISIHIHINTQCTPENFFLKLQADTTTYCELSNKRESMADSTGRSAMTAVVMMLVLPSLICCPARRLPPVEGFKPSIQTRCWRKKTKHAIIS